MKPRASSIPLEHQIQIMDWLRDNKQLFNYVPDYVVYAEYQHQFTDKLTGQLMWPDVSKSKFTRFLHTQGIVRRTARSKKDGKGTQIKVYGLDVYQYPINDRVEFRPPTKAICEHCGGTGWITPTTSSTSTAPNTTVTQTK